MTHKCGYNFSSVDIENVQHSRVIEQNQRLKGFIGLYRPDAAADAILLFSQPLS